MNIVPPERAPLAGMALREAMAADALAVAGLGAAATPDEYADLVAPADVEPQASRAAVLRTTGKTVSGCGLVVRGLYRRRGLRHPILGRPFVFGRGISDLLDMARDFGAVRMPLEDDGPGLGDAVIVGVNPDLHVFTVTSFRAVELGAPYSWELESVDGGQHHGTDILARVRRWTVDGAQLVDEVLAIENDPGAPYQRRPVFRYIDVEAMLAGAS